jgi:ribose 5-phosphate isomerase RpiB
LYAQEKSDGVSASALRALIRDGIELTLHENASGRALAEAIIATRRPGAILFCSDAATACCIANKIAGIRAGAVANNTQVSRVQKTLGANLFAIEIPGPTFFELRQMLRTIVARQPKCGDGIDKILTELDGHAHR